MLIAWSTFPDLATAEAVAQKLVEERLAACGTCQPRTVSIYQWEGKLEKTEETLVFFKIPGSDPLPFERRLHELHPYQVPEIIFAQPTHVSPAYLSWAEGCGKP